MASDPTDPSAGTDGAAADAAGTTTAPTQGVPIVPGVPFLPRQGADRDSGADRDESRSDGAMASDPAIYADNGSGTGEAEPGADGATTSDHGEEAPNADGAAGAGPAQSDAAGPLGTGTAIPGEGDSGAAASGVTALTGDAVDAPNRVHLNAYAVPVSTVPPSVLRGPTRTVPAPRPTGARLNAARAGDAGWRPSGVPASRTPARATAAAERAAEADDAAVRTSRRDKDLGPEPASALTADRLLIGGDRSPVSGWRRLLYKVTFGVVNMGDSDAVRLHRALEHRISVRLGGRTRYVPVLSRKGGVGKTTVTTLLGMALADTREDRIIAMDANPDRGTLSDRSPGRADHTARQLVQNRYTIDSFAQLAGYVTRDGSRLHVLASDTDPTVAQAFDDADYRAVTDLLSRYYSIVLTDSGTGMVHSVMKGTLEKADSVVLVSGGSVDEARLASETLSWLEAHGRQDLVEKAIVVINLSSGSGTQVDVAQIEQHFRSRVNTVVRIPYDRHLAEGSRVDLAKLNPATRRAVTELAALVVDQLAS